jgi:hypothetical protein
MLADTTGGVDWYFNGLLGTTIRSLAHHDYYGPSSFRVEPHSQNRWSSSSPVGMWAGCL